jgi:predicted RNA-binding protein with PIN domain
VRDACELAVAVAQSMEARDVPPALRRYLRMQRLPGASALAAIRRVLDADDGFRGVIAAAASEDAVDRPSWLFLTRPDGWDEELASLSSSTASASAAAQRERDERAAQRKLASVEAKLEDALASLRDASSRADAEHAARVAADASVRELSERVEALRHERDDARRRLARVESRLADLETFWASAGTTAPHPPTTVPEPAPEPAPAVDLDAVTAAITRARAALDAVAAAVHPASDETPRSPDVPAPAQAQASPPATSSPPRRQPLRLPGGLLDDSVDAADWLVRRPGAVVLVDGYNCTLRDTPTAGLPIPEQRRRLVDALTELASRTHADVEIVFDGADVDQPLATGRRGVRVTFSPPGTEADDVVIARSASLPIDRPVVVASSDNRVRAGAADHGANVISAEQLIAVVRTRR